MESHPGKRYDIWSVNESRIQDMQGWSSSRARRGDWQDVLEFLCTLDKVTPIQQSEIPRSHKQDTDEYSMGSLSADKEHTGCYYCY